MLDTLCFCPRLCVVIDHWTSSFSSLLFSSREVFYCRFVRQQSLNCEVLNRGFVQAVLCGTGRASVCGSEPWVHCRPHHTDLTTYIHGGASGFRLSLNPTIPGAVGSPVVLDTLWLKGSTKVPLLPGLSAHAFDINPVFFFLSTSASSVSPASLQFLLHPLSLWQIVSQSWALSKGCEYVT